VGQLGVTKFDNMSAHFLQVCQTETMAIDYIMLVWHHKNGHKILTITK